MFTGGSTGEPKCVVASHAMALHEVQRYPSIASELGADDRVLQQTSVFWAASAWGQIDIALAFGASLCISSSGAPPARLLREARITVLGAAPSSLAAWAAPGDAPSVRLAFSWGEAMPAVLAAKLRANGVRVVELLISTEYWLSFYSLPTDGPSGPGGPAVFGTADGVEFAVLPSTADAAVPGGAAAAAGPPVLALGAVGELCLRGPAVTPGYVGNRCGGGTDAFVEAPGGRYFRARDVVRVVERPGLRGYGIEFCGRSDTQIKVGAEFVNLTDLERKLEKLGLDGGIAACVLPHQAPGHGTTAHAFLAPLRPDGPDGAPSPAELAEALRGARRLLPHGAALHLLRALPRDAVTGKVQRRALAARAARADHGSTPLSPAAQAVMLRRIVVRYPVWWACLWAVCCVDSLLCALPVQLLSPSACTAVEVHHGLLRLAALPFVWFCSVLLLPNRCVDLVPFGRAGLILLLMAWSAWWPSSGPLQILRAAWPSTALAGGFLAARQRRFVPWFITFWCSAPHTLQAEVPWWFQIQAWRWWLCDALPNAPRKLREVFREAPQFTIARKLLARWGGASAGRRRVVYQLGAEVQAWSNTQRMWLPAEVVKIDGNWVTVRYCWPDGQQFDKELHCENPQISSLSSAARLVRRLRSLFRRAPGGGAPAAATATAACAPEATPSVPPPATAASPATKPSADQATVAWPSAAWGGGGGGGEAQRAGEPCRYCAQPVEETYRGYSLDEWPRWERRWWDECIWDSIDVAWGASPWKSEVEMLTDQAQLAEPCAEKCTAFEAKVLRLVERHVQLQGASLDAGLAGADSLSFMALCRAIRGDLGIELEPQEAMRSSTVRDLCCRLEEVRLATQASEAPCCSAAAAAAAGAAAAASAVDAAYAVYFAPSQWKGKCSWLYEADGHLDGRLFRAAAEQLIGRHQALRYTLVDPPELLPFVMIAGGLHVVLAPFLQDLLQRQGSRSVAGGRPLRGALAALLGRAQQLVSFGLKGAWPRVGPSADLNLSAMVRVVWCSTWEDVLAGLRTQGREFSHPFSIGLFLLDERARAQGGTTCKSFVYFVCTHAFSDGFTCFPLISELAELYERAAAAAGGGCGGPLPPPPPSAFAALQRRLFEALEIRPATSAPEQSSLRSTEFYLPATLPEPAQYNHQAVFEARAIAALRQCGREYGIPLDVVLFGTVTAALFRAGVCDANGKLGGHNTNLAEQLLTMALYVPMRDGASNEAMVGLFSDWREVSVAAEPGGCTAVLGLLLEMGGLIRSRRWAKFDALQNSERVLVNILALDERPRGACAFRQTRAHEFSDNYFRQQKKRSWRPSALRPMRLTLEQYERETWWLSMDLSDDCFPPWWCRRFIVALQRTVSDIVERPLAPLL